MRPAQCGLTHSVILLNEPSLPRLDEYIYVSSTTSICFLLARTIRHGQSKHPIRNTILETATSISALLSTDDKKPCSPINCVRRRNFLSVDPPVAHRGDDDTLLPLGVGLLLFALGSSSNKKRDAFLHVVATYRPAVVWLFAETRLEEYVDWVSEVRRACKGSQVWIQTCSVEGAVQLARKARPDVLVMQGADAGGHGWQKGAGVVSLAPETKDALMREGFSDVGVVASGGIVDARGVAAASSLGAEGVVMGTRFLASEEVDVPHPLYQQQILEAKDGGQHTVTHTVFDELKGPNPWPAQYDGRAIRSISYRDHAQGVSIDEIRHRHTKADAGEDLGYGSDKRAVVWSGTGVGLVTEVLPAAEIVKQVREGARARLEEAKARL